MGNHRAERRGPGRRPSDPRPDSTYVGRRAARPSAPAAEQPVESSATHYFGDLDHTAEIPLARAQTPGRRKAVKHAGSRGPLFRGLPSPPVLLGLATMAVAVGGVVWSPTGAEPVLAGSDVSTVRPATALSGSGGVATVGDVRATISRSGSDRTLAQASDAELVEAASRRSRSATPPWASWPTRPRSRPRSPREPLGRPA